MIHAGSTSPSDCGTDIAAIANNTTPCTPRGVRDIEIDPSDPDTLYAASYARGVWRSTDSGDTWTQIKPSLNATIGTTRPDIAVTRLPDGKTRMYVGEGTPAPSSTAGSTAATTSHGRAGLHPADERRSVDSGLAHVQLLHRPVLVRQLRLHAAGPAGRRVPRRLVPVRRGRHNGPYVANHRAVLRSTDAGMNFTDMTMDSTDVDHPNGMHPDQHRLVTNPRNPSQFFEASDGGIIRSSGQFADRSSDCDSRGLAEPYLSRCHELLSAIPTRLESMNRGLGTIQFQSLSVSPFDSGRAAGWDAGQRNVGELRKHPHVAPDLLGRRRPVGLRRGQSALPLPHVLRRVAGRELLRRRDHGLELDRRPDLRDSGNQFYVAIICDPVVPRTMYAGAGTATSGGNTVVRTKTHGMGTMTLAELRQHCNELTGDFAVPCGDWVELGPTALTAAGWGDRAAVRWPRSSVRQRTRRRSGPRPRTAACSSRTTRTRIRRATSRSSGSTSLRRTIQTGT